MAGPDSASAPVPPAPPAPVATAGDARFFRRAGPHSLSDIIVAAGGSAPEAEPVLAAAAALSTGVAGLFIGVAPLQSAGPGQVTFLDNRKYVPALQATRAGAVIVHPDLAARVPAGCAAIVTTEPYLGWARVAALFHPQPPLRPGRHPSAVVDDAARIDPSAEIGPLAVILAGAEIGPRCRIGPHAVIGEGVVLGPDCRIGAHASISHALLGARVFIYPGARIGQDGFGFAASPAGFVSVPQLGRVLIEDDVEVGANSTIDRGSAQDTVIGAGSRLDNLVQIGHNVRLGRCCIIVGQAGISGSTVLEDFVQVGGQAGLTGHLRIGRKARIGAQGGVMADVPAGADVVGSPSLPIREFFRQVVALKRLAAARPAGATRTDGGQADGGPASGAGGTQAGRAAAGDAAATTKASD